MKTSRSGPVIVGWDASPEAELALRHAHDRAGRLHQRLRVVIARGDIGRISEWADDWSRGLAGEWSEAARKKLAELGRPDLEPDVREGTPAEVLLAEAEMASCLVVEAGGHGPLSARLLGSVSQHLARHAACPVLVVRQGGVDSGPVVAGVDGSAESLRALEFALQEGASRGAPVEVVHALPRLHARAYLGFTMAAASLTVLVTAIWLVELVAGWPWRDREHPVRDELHRLEERRRRSFDVPERGQGEG